MGAEKLAVILIDVDPEYYPSAEQYLPKARSILEKHQLTWPNVMAPGGLTDTYRAFAFSGYGKIVVDARGIVRGVNTRGPQLEKLVEAILAEGK